jgi:protein-tyrosine phosphatase
VTVRERVTGMSVIRRIADPGPHSGPTATTATWWTDHDLVIALDGSHLRELQDGAPDGAEFTLLRDFDPATAGHHLDVPDPYYGGDQGFENVLAVIESSCAGLLTAVRRQLGR